jgi:hypothetical protein
MPHEEGEELGKETSDPSEETVEEGNAVAIVHHEDVIEVTHRETHDVENQDSAPESGSSGGSKTSGVSHNKDVGESVRENGDKPSQDNENNTSDIDESIPAVDGSTHLSSPGDYDDSTA